MRKTLKDGIVPPVDPGGTDSFPPKTQALMEIRQIRALLKRLEKNVDKLQEPSAKKPRP